MAPSCSFRGSDSSGFPQGGHFLKIVRQRKLRTSEDNAPLSGSGDPLRLTDTDIASLVFRHKGKELQDDVAEEGADQILSLQGIQKGHIQDHDIHLLHLHQLPPYLQNLIIVSSQAVNTL